MQPTKTEQIKVQKIFIRNLKYLIKKHNIKHTALAKEINMTRSAISNYLAGTSFPKWETLDAIAEVFHVSSDDLRKKDFSKETKILAESEGFLHYKAALFLPKLSSRQSLFHSDNFEGELTSPLPFCSAQVADKTQKAFAVNLGNDSILSCGIPKQSLVIFQKAQKVQSGDIAAVYFMDENKICIRLVTNRTHEYIFSSDQGERIVPKKDAKTTFKLLGKVEKVMVNL